MGFFKTAATTLKSLATKAATALGFQGPFARRALPAQTFTVEAYESSPAGTVVALSRAIKEQKSVRFNYTDKWIRRDGSVVGISGSRTGNPHAIWKAFNGTIYLHMYVDPTSTSQSNTISRRSDATDSERQAGDMPGWRTFIVSRINNVETLNMGNNWRGKEIKFEPAPGWNPGWYFKVGAALRLLGDK